MFRHLSQQDKCLGVLFKEQCCLRLLPLNSNESELVLVPEWLVSKKGLQVLEMKITGSKIWFVGKVVKNMHCNSVPSYAIVDIFPPFIELPHQQLMTMRSFILLGPFTPQICP
ncbi:hypothetical protein TNIN_21281 [Trichonephila inaurata madagascariensis]|uniref:Uncharacterized protein n=1 Tax=Trichonephila inaurata madagascariensis TaxID=2747483 RepID=A0A8X6XEW5_9ARAC|nr:hypothetical protein TNIN_21281 [Trichonephila inaurata madagascariensis]